MPVEEVLVGTEQLIAFLQQGIAWIVRFFETAWRWSFGEIVSMFKKYGPVFTSQPIWKQVLMVIVAAAVAYMLFRVLRELLAAVMKILDGFVTLLKAIVQNIVPLLIAGAVAVGGSWVVNNVNIGWLP